MGADLYIRSLNKPCQQKWKPLFNEAVKERDKHQRQTKEYKEAQKEVDLCYDQMYDSGYFRDSYNTGNVLWQFRLSWWEDVIPLLDKKRKLSVDKTEQLLALLAERKDQFQESMTECSQEDRVFFEKRAEELRDFLKEAVDLGQPIECSL